MGSELSRQLTQRFFRYLAITSQSDPKVKTLHPGPARHGAGAGEGAENAGVR